MGERQARQLELQQENQALLGRRNRVERELRQQNPPKQCSSHGDCDADHYCPAVYKENKLDGSKRFCEAFNEIQEVREFQEKLRNTNDSTRIIANEYWDQLDWDQLFSKEGDEFKDDARDYARVTRGFIDVANAGCVYLGTHNYVWSFRSDYDGDRAFELIDDIRFFIGVKG